MLKGYNCAPQSVCSDSFQLAGQIKFYVGWSLLALLVVHSLFEEMHSFATGASGNEVRLLYQFKELRFDGNEALLLFSDRIVLTFDKFSDVPREEGRFHCVNYIDQVLSSDHFPLLVIRQVLNQLVIIIGLLYEFLDREFWHSGNINSPHIRVENWLQRVILSTLTFLMPHSNSLRKSRVHKLLGGK